MKSAVVLCAFVALNFPYPAGAQTVTYTLQPGQYGSYNITGPTSGLLREDGTSIGNWDDAMAFALPDHVQANQLWFSSGWMAWDFPNTIPLLSTIQSISYTAEVSSECPGACNIWPSNLTVSLNGVAVHTWTIPGDPDTGWLVTWTVNTEGTYFQYRFKDGDLPLQKVSDVTIDDVGVTPGRPVSVKLSVTGTSTGAGLTIYGKGLSWFGGSYYPENVPTLRIRYTPPPLSACTYTLSRTGLVVGRAGADFVSLMLDVSPNEARCGWAVASRSPFISVSTCYPSLCTTGWGSTGVFLTIAANESDSPRWGIVTIAGQDIPVMQAGPPFKRAVLDVNRDGHLDLLWQHDTDGRLATWTMDGATQTAGLLLTPPQVPDTSWKLVGTGDLDGDGWSDLVWQNISDGLVSAWLMNGTTIREGSLLGIPRVADLAWRIRSVGDFNWDGRADLLWEHSATGQTALWVMDGLQVVFGTLLPATRPAGPSWRLAGTGDFNADGNLDVVWQNEFDGRISIAFMNGSEFLAAVPIHPSGLNDTNWYIRGIGDMNGDDSPDLVWQHRTSGALALWFMNGLYCERGTPLSPPAVADLAWRIVGPK